MQQRASDEGIVLILNGGNAVDGLDHSRTHPNEITKRSCSDSTARNVKMRLAAPANREYEELRVPIATKGQI